MNGWLLVDKKKDWTSFDAVNKVRSLVAREQGVKPRSIKVGHTGTLDPQATGLLVIGIGKATKLIQSKIKADKTYEATIFLGKSSSTGDSEGELIVVSDSQPTKNEIETVLRHFTGEIEQIPPQYSALKVGGVPAYKLARKGRLVELKPRKVKIYELELKSYKYPEAAIRCRVSSGTYIRTLAEDIGKELKTGAYLSSLRRIQVGEYSIEDSISLNNITFKIIKDALRGLD